jgi:hypothetical protein
MGILNEVGEGDRQCNGKEGSVHVQKRASFPSRERHYAVRRKTRNSSLPIHRCNRVPPQLPPEELPCDSDDSDISVERQGYCFVFRFKQYGIESKYIVFNVKI